MKSTAKTILTTVALFGAAFSAMNTRAADTGSWFEQQREITDGSLPQYTVPSRATRPATRQGELQDREFDLLRAKDTKPVPLADAARSLDESVIAAGRLSIGGAAPTDVTAISAPRE